jgi:hypothetical protein
MKRMLRDLGLILALAGLWAAGGYGLGATLETIGFDTYPLSTILASLNVILGMSLFVGVTKDPTADRLFFETGVPLRPMHPTVGCLWGLPLMLLVVGLSMWLWALILRLILPE